MLKLVETKTESFNSNRLFNDTTATITTTTTASSMVSSLGNSNNSSSSCGSSGSSSSSNSGSVNNSKFIDICESIKFMTGALMILDCRILREYESKHIKNSIHINCRDRLTKRRLSSKKLTVKDIISCEETKKKLDVEQQTEAKPLILLYDESTNDENDLFLDQNPLQIVLDNIRATFKQNVCKILKGGFKEFSRIYPQYCVQKEKQNQHLESLIDNSALNCEDAYKHSIENAKLTEILPHLYLGNECDAKNEETLKKKGITHVINVTKNIPCFFENDKKYKYKRIAVNDACNENLRQFFEETFDFIEEALRSNTKVLVHCQAGISRSPTIVIAYLMKKHDFDFNRAYNRVRELRTIAGPHIIFLSQLMEYEKQLNNSKMTFVSNEKPSKPFGTPVGARTIINAVFNMPVFACEIN